MEMFVEELRNKPTQFRRTRPIRRPESREDRVCVNQRHFHCPSARPRAMSNPLLTAMISVAALIYIRVVKTKTMGRTRISKAPLEPLSLSFAGEGTVDGEDLQSCLWPVSIALVKDDVEKRVTSFNSVGVRARYVYISSKNVASSVFFPSEAQRQIGRVRTRSGQILAASPAAWSEMQL